MDLSQQKHLDVMTFLGNDFEIMLDHTYTTEKYIYIYKKAKTVFASSNFCIQCCYAEKVFLTIRNSMQCAQPCAGVRVNSVHSCPHFLHLSLPLNYLCPFKFP